jgi:phage gp36-like protein
MSYATPSDYLRIITQDEAIESSNLDDPSAMLADGADLIERLALASAEIDGYLAVRFRVPIATLVSVPFLRQACVYIAWYNGERYGIREHVQIHYDRIIAQLTQYAAGKMVLIDEDGNPIDPVDGAIGMAAPGFAVADRAKGVYNPWLYPVPGSWGDRRWGGGYQRW